MHVVDQFGQRLRVGRLGVVVVGQNHTRGGWNRAPPRSKEVGARQHLHIHVRRPQQGRILEHGQTGGFVAGVAAPLPGRAEGDDRGQGRGGARRQQGGQGGVRGGDVKVGQKVEAQLDRGGALGGGLLLWGGGGRRKTGEPASFFVGHAFASFPSTRTHSFTYLDLGQRCLQRRRRHRRAQERRRAAVGWGCARRRRLGRRGGHVVASSACHNASGGAHGGGQGAWRAGGAPTQRAGSDGASGRGGAHCGRRRRWEEVGVQPDALLLVCVCVERGGGGADPERRKPKHLCRHPPQSTPLFEGRRQKNARGSPHTSTPLPGPTHTHPYLVSMQRALGGTARAPTRAPAPRRVTAPPRPAPRLTAR